MTDETTDILLRPIENNSSLGQAVYEPFSGSGKTIIAAEMTGRACHAIELNPANVDVAVERWQNFTGQEASLEGTTDTFAQTNDRRKGTETPQARRRAIQCLKPISEGKSLRTACAEVGVHSSWMDDLLDSSDEVRAQYARARDKRADVLGERGLTLGMAAATGQTYEGRKLDPAGVRVALDAIKWYTSKLAPKKYGDRQIIAGDPAAPLVVADVTDLERAKAVAALVAKTRGAG